VKNQRCRIKTFPLFADVLPDSRQFSRLEVIDTGRRRRWTMAEKLRIVAENFSGPRLASSTARRHGIFPTLLFAWRKASREGRLGGVALAAFVPAIIVPKAATPTTAVAVRGCMEVMSANGRRVVVGPDVDTVALLRVLEALESR
jgi:transposase